MAVSLRERTEHGEGETYDFRLKTGPNLNKALRSIVNPSRATATANLENVVQLVAQAASTIDEMVKRNNAVVSAASRSVARFRNEAEASKDEAEQLRIDVKALQRENDALATAGLARARELEAELATKIEELDLANLWIAHFHSYVTNLLVDVPKKLEMFSGSEAFDL